eukprot:COSAG05_NODE_68_length_22188_cov_8.265019_1_plen_39_part_00
MPVEVELKELKQEVCKLRNINSERTNELKAEIAACCDS